MPDYPNVELIVIDGGSTDDSIDVIRKHEPWIKYWVSEEDNGQYYAINKRFRRSTGSWVGWQNPDDTYAPGTLAAIGEAELLHPKADVFYGRTWLTEADNTGGELGAYCA